MSTELVPLPPPDQGALVCWEERLEEMRGALALARTAQQCLRLADAFEAVLAAVKIAGLLIKDQNVIARMKLDAERKAGAFLDAMPKAHGGDAMRRPRGYDAPELKGNGKTTYAEMAAQMGVSKAALTRKAKNAQLIWSVPDARYLQENDALEAKARLITSQHFIKLGREIRHKAHRRKLAAAVEAPHPAIRLGDFRAMLSDLPDQSVSVIFSDPPYDKASLHLYEGLAVLAKRVLMEGGSLVCYAAQHALPSIFQLTTPHVRYQWTFAVRHSGGAKRMHGTKVRVAWKPLLWFVKGRYTGNYLLDLLDSTPGDKSRHEWAQGCAEAAYLIEHLCPEGGLVLDPMCGSGTTLLAAHKLGRRWLGVESDRERCLVASHALQGAD